MPEVTEEFVKNAHALAAAVPTLLEKAGANTKEAAAIRSQAEMVADTLVGQGLIKDVEKGACATKLLSHEDTLNILNKTAQQVAAPSMGSAVGPTAEKTSSFNGGMRNDDAGMAESDRALLNKLGFHV